MSRRAKKNDEPKDALEAEQGHDSHSGGAADVRSDTTHTVVLSMEDKQDLVSMLMPKIEGFITKTIDARFKELEPSKESAGIGLSSGPSQIVATPGAGSTPNSANPAPDITNIIKQLPQLLGQPSSSGDGTAGQEGQPNPLGALLGGVAGGNPIQTLLLQVVMKELGLGQQQSNPMGAMMPELMMRAFMEDIAFGTALKKLAIGSMFKNPQIAAEFGNISDSFVGQPLAKAATLMTGEKKPNV